MAKTKQEKNERRAIYFDVFCGMTSSSIALTGIAYAIINQRVASIGWFTIHMTFWIGWLLFSLFILSLGIFTWYKEKHYDDYEQKKNLKAPIV
ncbi:MAG: hypothetical protein ACFFA4_14985 [Promethearchaeota archaeon]